MATLTYDGNSNIIQTLASNVSVGAVAPLTNAAVQPNISATAAPNVITPTTGAIKTTAISVNNTVSGQVISVVTNPA